MSPVAKQVTDSQTVFKICMINSRKDFSINAESKNPIVINTQIQTENEVIIDLRLM